MKSGWAALLFWYFVLGGVINWWHRYLEETHMLVNPWKRKEKQEKITIVLQGLVTLHFWVQLVTKGNESL